MFVQFCSFSNESNLVLKSCKEKIRLLKKNKTFAANNESYKSVDDNNALQNLYAIYINIRNS